MTARYVLHVGPHKTGTTSLQTAFTTHAETLLARGVLYPVDCGSLQGHYPLVRQIRERDMPSLRGTFRRFIDSGAQTILLSSEEFCGLTPNDLRILRSLMGDAEVTVIFYCRRPSELLLSGWRELTKHGFKETLAEYVVMALTGGLAAEAINLSIPLTRLTAVFGVSALRLVPYNTIMDAGTDLFQHFCSRFLDWPDVTKPGVRWVNRSIGAMDAELMRVLNRLEQQRTGSAGENLFQRFAIHRKQLNLVLINRAMEHYGYEIVIDETRPPVSSWQNNTRERFGQALLEPEANKALYAPVTAKLRYIHQDFISEPGVLDALHALHAHILSLPGPEPETFVRDFL